MPTQSLLMSSQLRPLFPILNTMAILIIVFTLLTASSTIGQARSVMITPEDQAIAMLERMTPEERVGQLFLITFQGTEIGPESDIFNLITQHNIGGVVLLAKNDNFSTPDESNNDTPSQVLGLTKQLQQNEWGFSRQSREDPISGENYFPAYIPLFIGLSQEGDGYPYDQILHGLTYLPNSMALGATWTPELATQVGSVLGKELSILGINLSLGLSLDVLEAPQLEATENLSTRTFGGDPYWVSEMGRAFVKGVHLGSENRVAVSAKHFPGHGGSDRLPEEEVATVRKSLEELKSFDLAPFFAVTGKAPTPEETVDTLLVSHIRYQGLQGNIRATTRPVSLDSQALSLLMELPDLDSWRKNGGVMISDDLGSLAVRRFYGLTSQPFDPRRVTLNAFLAGNDLLYIADFLSEDILDSSTATVRTLDFFTQKYREDSAFAQRVDESVLRILTLKFHLFDNFTLGNVLSIQGDPSELGQSNQATFEIARQAATLISPTQAELDETIPDPPAPTERIVFISDSRSAQQCGECPPFPLLEENALQEAVIRLYGSQAGGQIAAYNLSSYSLVDLQQMLDSEEEDLPLERDIRRATWIVLMLLSDQKDIPSFQTLRQFLTERPDLFQQKHLIAFALCAPYYLDATNISKLSAYYGLYSKTPQFVDVAAYLLFRELRPSGAPPVSVRGISYNLNQALFPDPEQVIPLELDLPEPETEVGTTATPEPPPPPEFRLGDVIPLRTGVILDHNGNPVPDGTPVNFIFTMGVEASSIRQVEITQNGIARTTFAISSSGTLDIIAESEAARSASIKLDIPPPSGQEITVTPTETPTFTPSPTVTTAAPQLTRAPEPPPTPTQPGLADWLMAVLISGGIAWASYRLAALVGQVRWGVRAGFLALISGLLAYSYLALQLPGSKDLLNTSVSRSVFLGTLAGTILGLLITFTWRKITETRRQRNPKEAKP